MRFLHTADWHLGRIFHNIHLTEDQACVLEQLVVLIQDVKPDAVVIAGDVYDRSVPPPEAVRLLDDILSRILLDCRVPVIVTAGNHDSPERLGFGDKVMARQNLHVIGQVSSVTQPVILRDNHGPVYFCPMPYAEPAVVRERFQDSEVHSHDQALALLARRFDGLVPSGARRVAVAHAFVAGGTSSESERPLSIGGIATVDAATFAAFHYVALGHLHQAQQVGAPHIRYSGSLLKYSFAEATHRKTVSLVELDAAGQATVEAITLTPRRNVRCLEGQLTDILAAADRDAARDDYVMVTLKDSGAILDAMGKLRQAYPNILHLERARFAGESSEGTVGDHRRRSKQDLFGDFFAQVTGQPLAEAEAATLARLFDEFARREREVGP
ncbi:MAG: exonuclease SbcCD subunit D [Negativicutes bacterium]|nr:exonuclease SbcCD subunit D [Negativicutes bacterium]